VVFLGSDPDEWMEGKAEILRVLEAQAPEMSSRASIAVKRAVAQAEDDWGWAAFNCTLTSGADAVPFRLTEVFKRRDDGWKIVHGHASVAVPNEDALGFELPT
jgi:ketosteroid isomerase-like protein